MAGNDYIFLKSMDAFKAAAVPDSGKDHIDSESLKDGRTKKC